MVRRSSQSVASAPSWAALRRLRRALSAERPGDAFIEVMLKGAFRVALDRGNPIRGNLFAGAMRELVTHVLHTLAPDRDVAACDWYALQKDTKGPTRAQRAAYITHGGLLPKFVKDQLGLDPKETSKPLIEAMDRLNRLTHVKRETVLSDGGEIRRLAADALDALLELFSSARECRGEVERELSSYVDQAVLDRLIGDVVQELDELSTHTQIDEHQSEDIEVIEIGPTEISFEVTGTVYVTLLYGSGSDRRRGDGAEIDDSYPYRAVVVSRAATPTVFSEDAVTIEVDNSSFYE